jgi:5'-nucleotidase / UDP-sugar diphosphatase
VLSALVLGVLATPAAAKSGTQNGHHSKAAFQLTLLHNNDAESKLLTGDSVTGYGGAARFSTVLDRVRRDSRRPEAGEPRKRGTLLVSSGDNFLAGLNLSASFAKGVPWYDSIAFDRFRYDAATIGNHEFDFGPDRLADFIRGTHGAPFLSANLDVSGEPSLARLAARKRIVASTIVKRDGRRIAIIGLTTPELPTISSPRNVTVSDALAEIANAEVRRVQRRGAKIVILSSHLQGIANERALIPHLRGVDVVIAGGGDELLSNPGDLLVPGAGTPFGPYPFRDAEGNWPRDADGRAVPMVTTPGEFRYVGRLTATFDKRGRLLVDGAGNPSGIDADDTGLVRVSGTLTDPDYAAPDPYIVDRVDGPLLQYRAALDADVIAQTAVRLDGRNPDPIRARESNLGNLVADAFRWTTGADVALTNGGGIRNNNVLPIGPITEGDTFRILPFDNLIVTVPDVPRDVFRALLENGYSVLSPDAGTVGFGGRFAHIAGVSVIVDRSQPVGQRVREATLTDGTQIVTAGAVVPGDPLDVATTDFLAKGGDSYPFGGRPFVSSQIAYQRSLFNYLTASTAEGGLGGQVTAAAYPEGGDGRIQITPALPPAPAAP